MMAKYRRLNREELQALEKEFIEFLVLNGIAAEDWEKIKEEDIGKAEKMVDIFSDMILETSLAKTEYLEYVSPNKIASIHCQENQMVFVYMEAPSNSQADFTNQDFIQKATVEPPSYLEIGTDAKPYLNPRSMTIWHYLEEGWFVGNGNLYKSLCLGL